MLKSIFSPKELDEIKDNLFAFPANLPDLTAVKEKGIVVFGAGAHGRHAVDRLLGAGVKPEWIIDNNPALQGTMYRNIKVRPLRSLKSIGFRFVLLTSGYMLSMCRDCLKYGVTSYLLPMNLPIFFISASAVGARLEELESNTKLEDLYDSLTDVPSRQTLKNLLAYQLTLDNKYFESYGPHDMYFPFGIPLNNTRYIDVGAFNGDTLRGWAARMIPGHPYNTLKYAAFEPGSENFNQLKETVAQLPVELQRNISIYPCGLGAKNTKITLSAELCLDTAHNQLVDIIRLDSVIDDFRPTVIKVDVEGAEIDVLEGARETLKKYRPGLAVCVYHKRGDLVDIPEWIRDLGLGYKIYLRHHQPIVTDTVCYAVAE